MHTQFAERRHRFTRFGAQRIRTGQCAPDAPVVRDPHDGSHGFRQAVLEIRGRRVRPAACNDEVPGARADFHAVDAGTDAAPHVVAEVGHRCRFDAALVRRGQNGSRQGVFTRTLHGRGERQQLVRVTANGVHLLHRGIAHGEGPGLVEHHGVQPRRPLQGVHVLDQDARTRGGARAGHDGRGRGEPQGAWTGDHQHRDGGDERRRHGAGPQEPGDEGQRRDGDDDGYEHPAHPVHQALDPGLAALRVCNQPDDARQGAVLAHRRGPHFQIARRVDAAAGHGIAPAFGHGQALPCQQRLVHLAFTRDHLAVHGDALPGPDQHGVPGGHPVDR